MRFWKTAICFCQSSSDYRFSCHLSRINPKSNFRFLVTEQSLNCTRFVVDDLLANQFFIRWWETTRKCPEMEKGADCGIVVHLPLHYPLKYHYSTTTEWLLFHVLVRALIINPLFDKNLMLICVSLTRHSLFGLNNANPIRNLKVGWVQTS